MKIVYYRRQCMIGEILEINHIEYSSIALYKRNYKKRRPSLTVRWRIQMYIG